MTTINLNVRGLGSVNNAMLRQTRNEKPGAGMPATVIYWTDLVAAVVTRVSTSVRAKSYPARIWVRRVKVTRKHEGMTESQDWGINLAAPEGDEIEFSLRKHGGYVHKGDGMFGLTVHVGRAEHYHDYSF